MTQVTYIEPGRETLQNILDNMVCLAMTAEAADAEFEAMLEGKLDFEPGSRDEYKVLERLGSAEAVLSAEVLSAHRSGMFSGFQPPAVGDDGNPPIGFLSRDQFENLAINRGRQKVGVSLHPGPLSAQRGTGFSGGQVSSEGVTDLSSVSGKVPVDVVDVQADNEVHDFGPRLKIVQSVSQFVHRFLRSLSFRKGSDQ